MPSGDVPDLSQLAQGPEGTVLTGEQIPLPMDVVRAALDRAGLICDDCGRPIEHGDEYLKAVGVMVEGRAVVTVDVLRLCRREDCAGTSKALDTWEPMARREIRSTFFDERLPEFPNMADEPESKPGSPELR